MVVSSFVSSFTRSLSLTWKATADFKKPDVRTDLPCNLRMFSRAIASTSKVVSSYPRPTPGSFQLHPPEQRRIATWKMRRERQDTTRCRVDKIEQWSFIVWWFLTFDPRLKVSAEDTRRAYSYAVCESEMHHGHEPRLKQSLERVQRLVYGAFHKIWQKVLDNA